MLSTSAQQLVLLLGIGAAACGGTTLVDDPGTSTSTTSSSSSSSSSSSGTTTSSSGTTTSTVPPGCEVPTAQPPPYATTFKFVNDGAQTVYLRETCYLDMTVTACADGYQSPVSLTGDCTVDCIKEPDTCIACGACPEMGKAVDPKNSTSREWHGKNYTFGTNDVECQCHYEHLAPAAKYRVSIPVFATEMDAMYNSGPPLFTAEVSFELPAPGGVVEIPIGIKK